MKIRVVELSRKDVKRLGWSAEALMMISRDDRGIILAAYFDGLRKRLAKERNGLGEALVFSQTDRVDASVVVDEVR